MKIRKEKKLFPSKELKKLYSRFTPGNKEEWVFAELFIDTIPGIDHDVEFYLKTKLKTYLKIV